VKPRDATADVRLWGSYADGAPIADPYYGGVRLVRRHTCAPVLTSCVQMDGFEEVYAQCVRYSNAFLDEVAGRQGAGGA
jgi:low molecular weight phosphotyrosine protein phosphatase